MAFLNPIFLLGAMAAALPVLVHLVRRTRAKKIEFASLMFLRRIEQKTIRKRRLRNLLLLALRCAALLLLALAFARPYFTRQSPAASSPDSASSVILIDGSYSMRYGDLFERARQEARDIINEAKADEKIALVEFAQSYDVLRPLKADRAEALAILNQAQAGLGATDFLQAIQAADSLLKEAGRTTRRIYLVSDFQQSGWNRAGAGVKLSPDIKLQAVDVSDAQTQNLAVSEVKAEPIVYAQKYAGKLLARVSNFGSDAVNDAAVELKLNDLTVERRQVRLDPATSETIEFSGFNVPEGSNRATVEISNDTFALDNRFFFTIRREDQTKVLAIETASRGRSESFFLQQSLAAGENNQHALTLKTAGTVNPAELDSYSAVVVNDAAGITDQLAAALKSFVERGGGLILAAGKHTDPAEFNRLLGSISPAQLGETVRAQGYSLMSEVKTDHPVFSAFARSGRLTSTRIYAYHRATPAERATTLAALDDGSPIVVEGLAGRGKVLLLTSTLDTAWNDLPLTPMFLPLVRQMLEYLSGRESPSSYTVGQVLTAAPDPDGAQPVIENPGGGRVEEARANSAGELSITAAETGFYRLRYRNRIEHLAVNLDTRESDFSKLNVDEFIASISPGKGDQGAASQPLERLTGEEIESRQRLWLPLFVMSLALFVTEALLARRIRLAKLLG